jgi:phospholipid transport system substrate-binding protein
MWSAIKIGAALVGVVLLAFFVTPQARADDVADAQIFVRSLADKAISQLTSPSMSQGEREKAFRGLLKEHFDVPAIGRSALGRYWRVATPEEQKDYLSLFEDLIVSTYAQRFRDYGGENLDILSAGKTASEEGNASTVLVQSQISRNVAKPIRIDWRVSQPSTDPNIVDVVIEGVSMVQTQRSEFTSVIVRNGNKVSGLIDELRAKVKTLAPQ